MGALMRAYDWSASPLGSANRWPQSLRTAVRILLTTQHPMFIWWGPDLIQFYNDAYRQTMGPERHPSALGQRGKECWQEIWDIIGFQIETVMRGEGATWHENQLAPVTRHGKREDVWWTYGFSPIDDENAPNGVGGILVVCNDVTDRHRAFEAVAASEERLRLALAGAVIGTWDWHVQTGVVFGDEPFARLYGMDPGELRAGTSAQAFVQFVHPTGSGCAARRTKHSNQGPTLPRNFDSCGPMARRVGRWPKGDAITTRWGEPRAFRRQRSTSPNEKRPNNTGSC
jgi:PAS domain-containing protein